MESDLNLNISFRFFELTEFQAASLKKEFSGARLGTHHKSKKTTGNVPLNSKNISLIVNFMNTHNLSLEITDIFISFVSEYDTHIIDIPEYVNEAVRTIGSKLSLSYTIV